MKIVIYFSALFGLSWLIHGVLSHHDPATKRKSIEHANADREEYSSFESQNVQDKVLIRSESPLRGRKIHQTAWSKEDQSDEGSSQVTKPDQTEKVVLENSWTLEKILKYLTSLVYPAEESDQPGHILITSELIRDGSEAKSKNKQKSLKKNQDEVSRKTPKNDRGEHSTHKLSYLEDYYESFQTETDTTDESDESYENSYEYENEDVSRIKYEGSSKIFWNNKPNHRFQDENGRIMKGDHTSSSEDDEDCSEETDIFLKKFSSKDDMEQSSEERNFKQETVSNKKYKGIKNILRSKTIRSGVPTKKRGPKIIVLNGTKLTGQNNENKENDDSLQTIIQRKKSKVELSDTEDTVSENISEETTLNEQQKTKMDSEVNQETIQQIIIQDISDSQTEKDVKTDTITELSTLNNTDNIIENTKTSFVMGFKPNMQEESKNTFIENIQTGSRNDEYIKNEVGKIVNTRNEDTVITTNNNDNIIENTKTSSVMRSKPNAQEESKNIFIENIQTGSRSDAYIKNEVRKTENTQNEDMVITTNNSDNIEESMKTSFIMKSKPHEEIQNKNSFIETKQSVSKTDKNIKSEVLKSENVQKEEMLITTSTDNTAKQNLGEKNFTFLETLPEILTFETKQENIQTINEGIVNNPAQVQTILIKAELKNDEKKEFDIQNKTEKISDTQIVEAGNYEEKTENFDKFSQHQASQIFVIENHQQNDETKNLNDQITGTRLISKDDNGYEYVLEGNEFVPLNNNNKEKSFDKTVVNNSASENKSQLLTESIVEILENVNQADNEQQETFETILEFLYKHSKNPFILALKENSSMTN